MSYCRKCGAKLREDAKFCTVCGTPVALAPAVAEPERRIEKRPPPTISTVAIVLIVLLLAAAIVIALAFLPFKTVDYKTSRNIPFQPGVHNVNLNFVADIANVNVNFGPLAGNLVILNVTEKGGVGVFAPADPADLLKITFDYTSVDDVLTVTSEIDVTYLRWPWFSGLKTECDIIIDSSLRSNIDVKTSVGKIVMNAKGGITFNAVSLEATTGGVETDLAEGVTVTDDITIRTTTGGVKFSWSNVTVLKNNVLVDLKTTTGGVNVDIREHEHSMQNVTLKAETTTGGVNLVMKIQNDVGAKIESATTLGAISVTRKVGFSGTNSLLQSNNYPAGGNFDVSLKATTGGISIDAMYTP